MCIIVHKCRTQYSTEQFWLFFPPNVQTIIKAQMLSTGGEWGRLSPISQKRDNKNTSCRFYASCTDFQSVNDCRSNWPVSCTSHYMVSPSTWPMMSSFSLTADGVSFDQPTTEHALSHKHRTVSATKTFLLPDPESGTICHRNCDTYTSALDNSETCWNRISLGFTQPRRIMTFWLLQLKSSLTYLLIPNGSVLEQI